MAAFGNMQPLTVSPGATIALSDVWCERYVLCIQQLEAAVDRGERIERIARLWRGVCTMAGDALDEGLAVLDRNLTGNLT